MFNQLLFIVPGIARSLNLKSELCAMFFNKLYKCTNTNTPPKACTSTFDSTTAFVVRSSLTSSLLGSHCVTGRGVSNHHLD